MAKYRGLLVLLIAIIFGLISAYMVTQRPRKISLPTSPKTETPKVEVVVAAETIKPGEVLTRDKLSKARRLKDTLPAQSFRNPGELVGKKAKDFIYEGELIRPERLLSASEQLESGVSSIIEEGKRAISVHVSEVSGVSGFLQCGDLVDVIATSTIDIPNFTGARISRVVAKQVEVLSGQAVPTQNQKTSNAVTLLVTPQQAAFISVAAEGASLRLVARNYGDEKNAGEVKGVFTRELGVTSTIPSSVFLIENKLKEVIPEAEVEVESSPRGIILHGEVEDQETMGSILSIVESFATEGVQEIKNLIRLKGPQQVQLEVTVAEISRSGLKKMGLGFLHARDFVIGVFDSGSVSGETGSDVSGINSVMSMTPSFSDAFQIAVHLMSEQSDIMSVISFLKSQGLAKILAEPTLVTMSGQEASFLVGGKFPVPARENEGTFIQFEEYGVMLSFLPTVLRKETINLLLATEVSELDYSAGVRTADTAAPGTKTRRAKTTLQLKDGQSFAMAGLLKETSGLRINKLPFLGDAPVLGTLFTRKEWMQDESELVIIVTAKLVRPMNKGEVPSLPGKELDCDPSDVEFFILDESEK